MMDGMLLESERRRRMDESVRRWGDLGINWIDRGHGNFNWYRDGVI